jgi:hypothetical protein
MNLATSSRERSLSYSAVAIHVSTIARSGWPSLLIVDSKASDIATIGINTPTTPAIPMTITSGLPSRCGR